MIHRWRLKLIYQMFAKLLSWMVLHVRSDTAKEIEILVLRWQCCSDAHPPLRISWSDRAVIAALGRILPPPRRRGFLVTPGHDPALASATRPPSLDRTVCPGRPPRHPRRCPRRDRAPGERESHLGVIAASTANTPDAATRSTPPPSSES
jgi:hypothetical protein